MLRSAHSYLIVLSAMLFSLGSYASTTWVPISVGDIITFIPYVPHVPLAAPENVQIVTSDSISTLSWADTEHASQFEVQALNAQGQWVILTATQTPTLVLSGSYANYNTFRVLACSDNTCTGSVNYSASVSIRSIIYIHTDLLGSPVAETDKNGVVQ